MYGILREILDHPCFDVYEKILLTRLALHGKEDPKDPLIIYDIFPSIGKKAKELGISVRKAREIIKLYTALNVLLEDGHQQKGKPKTYQICIHNLRQVTQELVDKVVNKLGIKKTSGAHGAPVVVHVVH